MAKRLTTFRKELEKLEFDKKYACIEQVSDPSKKEELLGMKDKIQKLESVTNAASVNLKHGRNALEVIDSMAKPGGEQHRQLSETQLKFYREGDLSSSRAAPYFDMGIKVGGGNFRQFVATANYWTCRQMLEGLEDTRMFDDDDALRESVKSLSREYNQYREELPVYITASIMWASAGFPVIDLAPDFFHSIAVTDFGDFKDDALKMPFPDFILRFPENKILGGARSAFIYKTFTVEGARRGEPEIDANGEASRTYEADLSFNRYRATLGDCEQGGLFTDWKEDETLDNFVGDPAAKNWRSAQDIKDKDKANAILGTLRRIIANTTLYINDKGGLPPQGEKRIGPDIHVEREHKEKPRFRVGRPIKLGREIREALTTHIGSTYKLAHKFIVRGHWRNQAYGEKRSLRKKMWIEPYWKGPKDLTDALSKAYVVE